MMNCESNGNNFIAISNRLKKECHRHRKEQYQDTYTIQFDKKTLINVILYSNLLHKTIDS
jgi:hypothetical protein